MWFFLCACMASGAIFSLGLKEMGLAPYPHDIGADLQGSVKGDSRVEVSKVLCSWFVL